MNQAFVDGQNLYMNTRSHGWAIDLTRFRVYLREKYEVSEVYYFLGAVDDDNQQLYEAIQRAGFILVFREHNQSMIGKKKGNVDTDIVFAVMEKIAEGQITGKVILVSGDGDYIKMVKYLARKDKLTKVLAPNRKSTSSLYRQIDNSFLAVLDDPATKQKIQRT